MSRKQVLAILLGFSVLSIIAGFIFIQPETFGICKADEFFECSEPIGNNIGQPLFYSSIALVLIFLVLIFFPEVYFNNWLKYAAWFIPVSAIWLAVTSDNCSGGLGLGLCFDKELATWWASGIYILLSLGVIAVTYFRKK